MKKYFAFDLETTGLDVLIDEPVEMAFSIVGEEGPYRVTSFLVSTTRLIHPDAQKIHGISAEECSKGMSPAVICMMVRDIFLNNKFDGIIGFNGFKFDAPMISNFLYSHNPYPGATPVQLNFKNTFIEDPAIWYLSDKIFHMPRPSNYDEMDFISKLKVPYGTRYNLKKLCEEYGVDIKNAHSAEGDLRATIELWRKMKNGYDPKAMRE